MKKPTPADLQPLRERLLQRQQQLRDELRTVQDERDDAHDMAGRDEVHDAGEQGEQLSRDEVRRSEQERDAAELRDIDAALQRFDENRYGECIDCAGVIALPRLQAQPSALRCIACQEAFEKKTSPATVGAARGI